MLQKTSILFLFFLFSFQAFTQIPEIKELKSSTVTINKQKFTKQTGYFEVPENRDKPNGRILKLPIHIYRSSNLHPAEPIFWLEGGPGAANIKAFTNTGLLANHDFVMAGYRGADGATALKSKKVSKAVKGLNHQLLSDESLDNASEKLIEFTKELEQKGVDLTKYTIMDVIDDMEYIRKALNASKINLFSLSYGTRIALLYGYKFPEAINRSVMLGANPPGHFIWHPQKTEQLLDKYDSLYSAQNLPNYQGSIKAAMRKSFENMPKQWSVFRLDADKIKSMTFGIIYSTDGAAMAFDAYFKAANKGDYSGLYLMQLFFDIGMTKGNLWGDMFAKGISADFEKGKDYRVWHRSFDKTTTLGPNYSMLLWGLGEKWNPYLIPEEYRRLRRSETHTLILSGNLDNSTPADYATEKLLPNLPNGHQVILKDYSHAIASNYQKGQIRVMIAHYFKTGEVDQSQIKYQPINFKPKKSLNKMAKWGFPLWLVMSWVY